MIGAIVLAAGRSRRMGRQKLLLPLGAGTVISCVVDAVRAAPVDEVLVVVGRDRAAIEQALRGRSVRFVSNPAVDGDMLSSVRCGLEAMAPADGVLVVLGDQPRISHRVATELVRAFESGAGPIVVPTHQGRRGHPLLFSTAYRDEVLASFDDTGLRGLLQSHPADVVELEFPGPEILEDVDLPEDYRRICGERMEED